MIRRVERIALALCFSIFSVGCGAALNETSKTAEDIVRTRNDASKIVDAATGEEIELSEFYRRLSTMRVVYVAERHDSAQDHGAQYSIVRASVDESSSVAIGLEAFPKSTQPVLDRWVQGELDENALRRETDYNARRSESFDMLRPLLEYARARHTPLVALNAPRELTGRIAEVGVAGLSAEEKSQLPQMNYNDAAHRKLLEGYLGVHVQDDAAKLQRYYEAQLCWDETMAETVAGFLSAENPTAQLVVLAGRAHIEDVASAFETRRRSWGDTLHHGVSGG
ncbi:MAG: ChaN family lipoprotein [Polyangiales bacterium]